MDGQIDEARKAMSWYVDVFGRDRFFIELQMHEGFKELVNDQSALAAVGERVRRAARRHQRRALHQAGRRARAGHDDLHRHRLAGVAADRMRMTDNSYYLKSYDEMPALFGEVPRSADDHARDRRDVQRRSEQQGLSPAELRICPPASRPIRICAAMCEAGAALALWRSRQRSRSSRTARLRT